MSSDESFFQSVPVALAASWAFSSSLRSDDSRSSSRLYQKSCISLSGQLIVVSSLGGMPFSTSSLVRRSMNGRISSDACESCSLSTCAPLAELSWKAVSKAAEDTKRSG